MNASLSVLLPVCNAQGGLESQVERVLDVLPDITERFDVVIVDDGSTDETHEVARDLARRYPQVEVVRHAEARGEAEAIQTGLGRTREELVLVHTTGEWLNAGALADAVRSTTSLPRPAPSGAKRPVVVRTDAPARQTRPRAAGKIRL